MPSDPLPAALADIGDNARLAQSFVAGSSLELFRSDIRTIYAVIPCLEIVSEASRRLPAAVRSRYPDLPWRAIMDAGNVYRHEYGNVAEDFVWRTVQQSLPPLLQMVDAELRRLKTA